MLSALAGLAARRPRLLVTGAACAAIGCGVAGASVAHRLDPYDARDPASESSVAAKRISDAIGIEPDPGVIALVRLDGPVRSAVSQAKVEAVAETIFRDPGIAWVSTVYERRDAGMVSRDNRLTYVLAQFKPVPVRQKQDAAKRLLARFAGRRDVTLSGYGPAAVEISDTVAADLARAELVVLPVLFGLSLLLFRSVVASLLPVLVGVLAIALTSAALRAASELTSVSIFAINLATGLTVGLSIDYSLLIVSRYREEMARAGPGEEALRRTLSTAGRTVLFSSCTVTVALAGLLVFPQPFIHSMGVAGMLVALIAGTVALLVLPAVLVLLGPRLNAFAPARLRRAAERDARPISAGAWYRLSRLVMRHPVPIATSSAAVLIALGLPFLGVKFALIDPDVLPRGAGARTVHDALNTRFPPTRRTKSIYLAVRAPAGPATADYADRVRRLPDAADVKPPGQIDERLTVIEVIPRSGGTSAESQDLVRHIRALPTRLDVAAGGVAADFVDEQHSLGTHIPLALLILAGGTLALLFLMTGSVILPIKALVMTLLSISAAFGVLVVVFQHGRLERLLGYTGNGALESSQPLVLFAIAFGLSTDYGAFMLSRIKEAHDAGASNREAVATGLERTGRIVTAAALLFCVAFGAFAMSRIVFIKELGIGAACAVLIDATIVRALMVPSLMALLGRWNWWSPRPLRTLHARLAAAGAAHGQAEGAKNGVET